MKHTIRFIILFVALVVAGAGNVRAISESDIIINVLPNSAAGTVTNVTVSGMTVTFTANPASGYSIDANHITAEKMVDASAPRRAPGMSSPLPISGNNPFSFTIPEGYTGAYVTVNFYQEAPEGFTQITSLSDITDMNGKYQLTADVSGVSTSLGEFKGTLDGGFHKIIGSSKPLFASTDGAIIRNIIFEDVNISSGDSDGDAGAVTSKAKGATRIYNCGILPSSTERDNDGNITGFYGSSISGTGNVGGLVGALSDNARVINCYSYATITGGSIVAGIVGNIGYEEDESITQSTVDSKGMVVNCMFYGDITGGTSKYPVYGGASGAMIKNDIVDSEDNGIGVNPYCYYRKNAKFDDSYSDIANYKRSWPAEEKNLTRFEYYRSILNSNRHLCTYWVTGKQYASQTAVDTALIAKWVLDPTIAPYPILKKWGKYPSVINKDPVYRYNPSTGTNELRSSANEWEGKRLRTISVSVVAGDHHAGTGSTSKTLTNVPVLDMDTLNCDYAYAKIQLPYYNEVFGDPSVVIPTPSDGEYISKWNQRYGGNYKEYVVTGWDVSGGSAATNYNFADRNSYSGRVYAQGGYFYVPEGVSSITITAHWGKAVYLANRERSIDRVKLTIPKIDKNHKPYKLDKPFTPAGTISQKFGTSNNIFKPAGTSTIYGDLQSAIKALGTKSEYPTVYDQAIVLIGNHQVQNGSNKVEYSLDNKWHPFTIMSADFDIDSEPDFCLELQFRDDVDRPGIQPIRFDFLPVVELGLAVRHDNKAYAIGIFVPQGHFEVTETALIRTTQFEYYANITKIEDKSPVILNGGEFEMFTVRYQSSTASERDRISYFLLGGNVWVHRFAPGAHPNTGQNPDIYLFPVNVIGGQIKELYLTGLYRPELPKSGSVIGGAPRCYIDGGKFDIVAGAGYEKVKSGEDVIFKINHSRIGEFYGGGINGSNPITGNIDVTIDYSLVDKYCGGPKVGDMSGKTVTTHATGTTFGVFYGGGNGGNSYYRQLQRDGDFASNTMDANWESTKITKPFYNFNGFTPLATYYDDGSEAGQTGIDKKNDNKGYHAEYEFEVFNQSNGLKDEVTQRGFIKWIQFGITKTGDVSNILSDCKILNNFYGGGNLATVNGNVSSTLTNTQVNGSVFGAGYSAAIPTFQVHDKDNKVFPSLDKAGTVIDGYIPYASTVYEWTNDLNGETEANRKKNPTYEKGGKLYCYTWNPLENLGAVTGNVSLTIDGNAVAGDDGKVMTVGESVYGGGEESAVGGDTEVTVEGGTIGTQQKGGYRWGNVYGGGKGKIVDEGESARLDVKSIGDLDAGLVKGNTNITINGGSILHNVYGGGAIGSVGTFTRDETTGLPKASAANTGQTIVTINGGTIGHNRKDTGMVDGSSRGWEGNASAEGSFLNQLAWINSSQVIIGSSTSDSKDKGPSILGSVYGGGENGHNYGNAEVTIHKGTIGQNKTWECGNVYGAGCGTDTYTIGEDPTEHHNAMAGIVYGTTSVTVNGGNVLRNIYGGGAMGSVGDDADTSTDNGKTIITINGGHIGAEDNDNYGHVFGGPKGDSDDTEVIASVKKSQVTINANATPANSPVIEGSVFGGGENGIVKGDVAVNITGGSIAKDVYGGGALADTQTSNWDASVNSNAGGWATGKSSSSSTTTVRLTGGTIHGEAYGGGLGEEGKPAYVYGDVLVELNNNNNGGTADGSKSGCAVDQVFGCNNVNGTPKGDVMVHVYATQNKNTDDIATKVPLTFTEPQTGKVTYWSDLATGVGLNPTTIIGEESDEEKQISLLKAAVEAIRYDVKAVYGGGNMAAYEPLNAFSTEESKKNNAHTNVIIDGCELTSIKHVYGGGNAASTPATSVTINGTYEIEEVFGGGNGKDAIGKDAQGNDIPNPGANVGFKDYSAVEPTYDTKEKRQTDDFVNNYVYGTGKASVNIFGGTVHRVFGGSNTKGNVRQTAVTLLDEASECEFHVDEAYGGGKSAPMDAEAKLLMACIPGLAAAYGGAEAADIQGNVTLNITNGTFDRVFGGNNESGTIRGSITVNVEEVGCRPIIIGELYGGGNLAAYSIYGYHEKKDANNQVVTDEDGNTVWEVNQTKVTDGPEYASPLVNVKSFTSIGTIYGGGYGSSAVMVGNPTVNVSVAYGNYYNDDGAVLGDDAKTPNGYPVPSHEKTKIGAINNVFGGGNAAKVIGNTNVNIGTLSKVLVRDYVVAKDVTVGSSVSGLYTRSGAGTVASPYKYTEQGTSAVAETGVTYYEETDVEKDVIGVDIRGDVYGGGNNAEVTGDTHVTIGKETTPAPSVTPDPAPTMNP